jgi:hypothetical protein
MTSREEFIEKAAKAITPWAWGNLPMKTAQAEARRDAEAAFAVFEEAHAPTDDEREVLIDIVAKATVESWDSDDGTANRPTRKPRSSDATCSSSSVQGSASRRSGQRRVAPLSVPHPPYRERADEQDRGGNRDRGSGLDAHGM